MFMFIGIIIMNPFHLILWRYRRQESDVRHLYETFRDFMMLASAGKMLNFGYWNNECKNLIQAQTELCRMMLDFGELKSNQTILDAGSGVNGPSILWHTWLNSIKIINLDICRPTQYNLNNFNDDISVLEASALTLPLKENSVDRIIALESAQHFIPIEKFLLNSFKTLKNGGILVLAIPGINKDRLSWYEKKDLGLLGITWVSGHHNLLAIRAILESMGFHDIEMKFIGKNVYAPLADYYSSHREEIKKCVMPKYSSIVEYIIFKSMLTMKKVAQKGIIDYALIRAEV